MKSRSLLVSDSGPCWRRRRRSRRRAALTAISNFGGHPDLSGTLVVFSDRSSPPTALSRRPTNGARDDQEPSTPAAGQGARRPRTSPGARAAARPRRSTSRSCARRSRTSSITKARPIPCSTATGPGIPRIGPAAPHRSSCRASMSVPWTKTSRAIRTGHHPGRTARNKKGRQPVVLRRLGRALGRQHARRRRRRTSPSSTWFGEDGLFPQRRDARDRALRRKCLGASPGIRSTVDDPKVLDGPGGRWRRASSSRRPEPLEESPKCTESDSKLLVNDDHHGQR